MQQVFVGCCTKAAQEDDEKVNASWEDLHAFLCVHGIQKLPQRGGSARTDRARP